MVGFASLIPCKAIEPNTVKEAVSSSTALGMCAHSFSGTDTNCA